ncbi:hypothetical protein WS67_00010 [Burkholderia singularis]|uniref:Uncharacterized protein n=1 Tax=Burkholderia singularis TaxID=1503053 RepID=A0A103E7U2_9BURK|nr:hypothetical protein WS67_00010 [Burkholderia singularis]
MHVVNLRMDANRERPVQSPDFGNIGRVLHEIFPCDMLLLMAGRKHEALKPLTRSLSPFA